MNKQDNDLARADAKMQWLKLLAVVALLAFAVSLILLRRTPVPSAPRINPQVFVGLGQVLGEETVKALDNHGRVVIVISDDYNKSGNQMNDVLEAFRGVLKKHLDIEITGTEVIRADAMMSGALPSRLFNELVKKHSDADGLIFFTGLPLLDTQSPLQLPTRHPQIITLQIDWPLTKPYFQQQIVNMAINIKVEPTPGSPENPKTPREWFDKFYDVITPQNAATLMD